MTSNFFQRAFEASLAGLLAVSLSCPRAHAQVPTWKDGIVPYVFASDFPESGKPAVYSAMKQWISSQAKLDFIEYPNLASIDKNKPYLFIHLKDLDDPQHTDGFGAATPRGMFLNGDTLPGSESHYVHELGHVIGFPHEQARPDRDLFVILHPSNFGDARQFDRLTTNGWPIGGLSQPYDYLSIMHYDHCTFSKYTNSVHCDDPNNDTMTAVDSGYQFQMGKWLGVDTSLGLSSSDINKVRNVYGNALWVGGGCNGAIEDGSAFCHSIFTPYFDIGRAANAVPLNPTLPYTIMIRPGTYTSSGTLRIAKAVRLQAPEGPVRID